MINPGSPRRIIVPSILSVLLSLSVSHTLRAEEGAETTDHGAGTSEPHHAKFAVAAFLGATRVHGSNEATLGFEGAYSINETWSVGAVVERADRENDSTLVLLGPSWHPFGPAWRFQFGLGRKDPEGEQ